MTNGRRRSSAPRCWSLDEVIAWIMSEVVPIPSEMVPLTELCGRVLAIDVVDPADEPPRPCAVIDGLAVRADDLVGATAYNPLSFRLAASPGILGAGEVALLDAGNSLPGGADTIVPLDYTQATSAGRYEVIDTVPTGHGIDTAGSHAKRGATVFSAGRRLGAADIGALAQLGIGEMSVIRRPRTGLVLAGRDLIDADCRSTKAGTRDANGPMVSRLIERDGGVVVFQRRIAGDAVALGAALGEAGLDMIVVVGGTGNGPNDRSSSILAETGSIAIDEIALHPGGSAVFGRTAGGTLVCLLPGRPAASFWAYEVVVGGMIRKLGGRDLALPHEARILTLARKVVSTVGMTEVWPVRMTDVGHVEPVTAAPRDSLLAVAAADGFIMVPEASEGLPADRTATVYLWGSSR